MRAAATSASASGIRFTSDQGIILTGPDSLYRLAAEVLAVNGHRRLDEALRWRSDPNPRVGRRPLPATM
jgi:hypothetical protein